MKHKITQLLSLTNEEIKNFEALFTIDCIKLEKYEHKSRENFYEKYGLKDYIVFFYATDNPEQDFNVLSFDSEEKMQLVELQKIVNIIDQFDEPDLEAVCHCLQYVLKPIVMTKIILNLENRDKQKIKGILKKK